jgi:hypothetical protein
VLVARIGLEAAAAKQLPVAQAAPAGSRGAKRTGTVLIGAHFDPVVRRTLLLVQAEPANDGKHLQDLLGEAINDLCAKYGKPQPFSGGQGGR